MKKTIVISISILILIITNVGTFALAKSIYMPQNIVLTTAANRLVDYGIEEKKELLCISVYKPDGFLLNKKIYKLDEKDQIISCVETKYFVNKIGCMLKAKEMKKDKAQYVDVKVDNLCVTAKCKYIGFKTKKEVIDNVYKVVNSSDKMEMISHIK
ncbi:MAG: hypothetical protein RSC09_05915 [Clostridia bacterium]